MEGDIPVVLGIWMPPQKIFNETAKQIKQFLPIQHMRWMFVLFKISCEIFSQRLKNCGDRWNLNLFHRQLLDPEAALEGGNPAAGRRTGAPRRE